MNHNLFQDCGLVGNEGQEKGLKISNGVRYSRGSVGFQKVDASSKRKFTFVNFKKSFPTSRTTAHSSVIIGKTFRRVQSSDFSSEESLFPAEDLGGI